MNIVFDLDGTIISNGQKLDSFRENEIKQLSKHHEIIFASGRPIRDMLPVLPESFHQFKMVGCNGAQTYVDQKINCAFIPSIVVFELVEFLISKKTPFVLDGEWDYFISDDFHPFHDYLRELSDNIVSFSEILKRGITKILILDKKIMTDPLFNQIINSEKLTQTKYNEGFFDVSAFNTNKREGIKKLGLSLIDSICVGNDFNDFEMLSAAEYSIFVGSPTSFDKATYYCQMSDVFDVINDIIESIELENISNLRSN